MATEKPASNKPDQTFRADDLPWRKSEGHVRLYVNNIGLAATEFDVQLRLAQTVAEEGQAHHSEIATVFMAPNQAKALVALLLRAVTEWEDKHKTVIKVPSGMQKQLEIGLARMKVKRADDEGQEKETRAEG